MSADGEDDYEVGYGKPPAHTRFKKGQSGNPTGKRKGTRSALRQLERFLDKSLIVNEGGKRVRMTPVEIVFRSVFKLAAQGNIPAAKLMLELQRQVDQHRTAAAQQEVNYADAIPKFLALIERQGPAQQDGGAEG